MSFKPYKPRDYASTKDVVTRLVDQAGGLKRAAHLIDRSVTQTAAYTDPSAADEMSLDQVRRLAAATRAAAPAEDLAALAHGVFLPIDPSAECREELTARSAQEWGEFFAALLRNVPGRVQLKELDDVLRLLVCVRAHLASEIEAGSAAPAPDATTVQPFPRRA